MGTDHTTDLEEQVLVILLTFYDFILPQQYFFFNKEYKKGYPMFRGQSSHIIVCSSLAALLPVERCRVLRKVRNQTLFWCKWSHALYKHNHNRHFPLFWWRSLTTSTTPTKFMDFCVHFAPSFFFYIIFERWVNMEVANLISSSTICIPVQSQK